MIQYNNIILSAGVVILVTFLTLVTTSTASKSADDRQTADRITSADLKIAEFRQRWINDLRDDLSAIVGLSDLSSTEEERLKSVPELRRLYARVELRLNPEEDAAIELKRAVCELVDNFESQGLSGKEKRAGLRADVAKKGAIYLKTEWEVVKKVLRNAKNYTP